VEGEVMKKEFNIAGNTVVLTSTYVTKDKMPILYVSHDDDEEGGSSWQFHCGNGDYSMEKMQLVTLNTIIALDTSVHGVSDLPMGFFAIRKAPEQPWVYVRQQA
jgi:hypothetical protein